MCPSGTTSLSADCCFSELALHYKNPTKHVAPLTAPPCVLSGEEANTSVIVFRFTCPELEPVNQLINHWN
jgi:hypothetical protein